MAHLHIHQNKINAVIAAELIEICPFSAISYVNDRLEIGPSCRTCKLCVKKGPAGAIEFVEDKKASIDKSIWQGIAVFADFQADVLHNVTLELLGKAKELAAVTRQPVYALIMGENTSGAARKLLEYGADKVYVYEHPRLANYRADIYTDVFEDFINAVRPSAVLVGATDMGRSLAPRVAARFRTGLTADCTVLEMKENSDLVQIRPAFGGNIMAQIVNPDHRPQFCTVRYKVFSAPVKNENPTGEIIQMELPQVMHSAIKVQHVLQKRKELDISEAEVLVAVGRGLKKSEDLEMVRTLAELLGGHLACTRPLVECGWFDAKHQIGLSGRTVAAKLIITLGISGAVQFSAGMKGCDCIIAVNSDPDAPIFDTAHYGVVGDMYRIVPQLIELIKEGR